MLSLLFFARPKSTLSNNRQLLALKTGKSTSRHIVGIFCNKQLIFIYQICQINSLLNQASLLRIY